MRTPSLSLAFALTALAALVAPALAAGCASSPPAAATTAHAGHGAGMGGAGPQAGHGGGHMRGPMGDAPADCPMMAPDVTVRAEDVDGGAALVFTTPGDPGELRARVAKMAAHHNTMHDGAAAGARGPGRDVRASTARVEDIDGGARLILTPQDPAELDALRTHTRKHAAVAKAGTCPMQTS